MIKKILLYLSTISILALSSCSVAPKTTIPSQIVLREAIQPVTAQDGQDTLACARFKDAIVKAHPKGQGIGCFAEVDGFGDGIAATDYILSRRKDIPFSRLQLKWRDDHNFSAADFPSIVKTAKRACPLTNKHRIKWYFSGATEHRLNAALAKQLSDKVKDACPSAEYVNNPLHNGATVPGVINESHGRGNPRSPMCAFSWDGRAAEDGNVPEVEAPYNQCRYKMKWGPRYNGKSKVDDSTPRGKRVYWADADYIKGQAWLTTNKGETKLAVKSLWKPISEINGTGRGKPVGITNCKSNSLILKKSNKTIATIPYFGTYQDGRFRYYAKEMGYSLGQKCGGVCEIYCGSKKLGTINAGFRENEYRN